MTTVFPLVSLILVLFGVILGIVGVFVRTQELALSQ